MEDWLRPVIPALLTLLMLRVLLAPIRMAWKIGIHCLCGFLCLWVLNAAAPYTGISFPIRTATVLLAGFGGLPAMALMALLRP